MYTDEKTGYGLRFDKLLHISQVDRGLACTCICVACRKPLVAKKGQINEHHFSHAHKADCVGASETILHLLSKELFATLVSVSLPSYVFRMQRETRFGKPVKLEKTVAKGGVARIDSAQIERSEVGFVPDIVVHCGKRSLIVEIAVTHKVSRNKMRHIRRRDIPAIEIQLDLRDALLDRRALAHKLQNDLSSKMWLFHPEQREVERRFFAQYRLARAQERAIKRIVASRESRPLQVGKSVLHTRDIDKRSLVECDRQIWLFWQKHGREPTMKECLTLWPQFWAP